MALERSSYSEDLITNGLSSVTSGLEDFDAWNGPKLKRALGLVFGGALLIIKERIRRVDESAIYTNAERTQTLNFKGCLRALREVAEIQLAPEHEAALKAAQQLRNQIEHADFSFEIPATLDLLSRLVGFLYVFMREHLAIHLDQRVDAYIAHRLKDVEAIASQLDQDFLRGHGSSSRSNWVTEGIDRIAQT